MWLRQDPGIAVLYKLLSSVLTEDTEVSHRVEELTDKLDTEEDNLSEGPVAALVVVTGKPVTSFLHGSNGGRSCNTACRAAGCHIPVAGSLFQLLYFVRKDRHEELIKRIRLHRHDAVSAEVAVYMNEIICSIGKLFLVHSAVGADEVTRPRVKQHVLKNCLVAAVNILLSALADINIAKSGRSALAAHERIKHERVQAVIVPAAICVFRVILRSEKRFVLPCYEFTVVQERLAVRTALLIVPVYYGGLVIVVNCVVVDVPGHVNSRVRKTVSQLRVLVFQNVIVLKGDIEDVPALLDIRDAGFPEEVNQINAGNVDISEAVVLTRIPEHAIHAGAALNLIVHHL